MKYYAKLLLSSGYGGEPLGQKDLVLFLQLPYQDVGPNDECIDAIEWWVNNNYSNPDGGPFRIRQISRSVSLNPSSKFILPDQEELLALYRQEGK